LRRSALPETAHAGWPRRHDPSAAAGRGPRA
jgi:hypothetical protein